MPDDFDMNIADDSTISRPEQSRPRKRFSLLHAIAIIMAVMVMVVADYIIFTILSNYRENSAQKETPKPIIKVIQVPQSAPQESNPNEKWAIPKVETPIRIDIPFQPKPPVGLMNPKQENQTGEVIQKDPDGVYRNYRE